MKQKNITQKYIRKKLYDIGFEDMDRDTINSLLEMVSSLKENIEKVNHLCQKRK